MTNKGDRELSPVSLIICYARLIVHEWCLKAILPLLASLS